MLHAARLELRNYPTALLRLKTPQLKLMDAKDGKNGAGKPERFLDIGAVDVWRGREARLPLWNDFREVSMCQSLTAPTGAGPVVLEA
jgi:hypothetical protein